MNVSHYLARIGYTGPREATSSVLEALQVAHLRTVPFENLSIHRREPIVLREDALYDKIVQRRRGGFCYELNGLFAALLRELGFAVERLAARVYCANGELGIPFDHMALRVTLDGEWLVDVGFGASFLRPLRLQPGREQSDETGDYRIDRVDGYSTLHARPKHADPDAGWQPQYRFSATAHELVDFTPGCEYHQTSPDSHFTRKRICSMATPEGRISLTSDTERTRLITSDHDGRRDETTIAPGRDVHEILHAHFGIHLTPPESRAIETQ